MNYLHQYFKNSRIHDYKLYNISVDYSNQTIIMVFKNLSNCIEEIKINNFLYFSITNKKEWGIGDYVVFSDSYKNNDIITIEIQLNSGDMCKIRYCILQ